MNRAKHLQDFLDKLFQDTPEKAIAEQRCVKEPVGCGKAVKKEDFHDEISRKEYEISGLCQTCQDKIFES